MLKSLFVGGLASVMSLGLYAADASARPQQSRAVRVHVPRDHGYRSQSSCGSCGVVYYGSHSCSRTYYVRRHHPRYRYYAPRRYYRSYGPRFRISIGYGGHGGHRGHGGYRGHGGHRR